MVVTGVAATGAGCEELDGAAAGEPAGDGSDDCGAGWAGAGDDEAGVIVCCAVALSPISREAVIIHFQVRITQILSFIPNDIQYDAQYASWKTTCTVAMESTG
jgi:hypothetical protein